MIKLSINSNSWKGWEEFEISYIQYGVDEKGIPFDIVIVGKEEVLEAICEYARIGCTTQPISIWAYTFNILPLMEKEGATHEMLIGRLPEFTVKAEDCLIKYQPLL